MSRVAIDSVVLELTEKSGTGETVLIHVVELGFSAVPLYRVFLKSDLVFGPIIVGVRPTLPVEGVSLLLGIDLAGSRVNVGLISSLYCWLMTRPQAMLLTSPILFLPMAMYMITVLQMTTLMM